MSRLWHNQARVVLITGKRGTGKSTVQIRLVSEARAKARIFIFDHKLEFAHKLGWKAQVTVEQMNAAAVAGQPVLFYPARMFPIDRKAAFDFFCRWVFEVSSVLPGKKLLVIDEVQEWTDVWATGIGDGFQMVINDGRLRGIDMLLISQTPNAVNAKIRAQITEVYCFKHTDNRILEWLENDPFCLDRGEVTSLQKPGGWIWRNVDTDEMKRSTTSCRSQNYAPDDKRETGTRPDGQGTETRGARKADGLQRVDRGFPSGKRPPKALRKHHA